ncbi:Aste57867_16285 [Aphanomyces stellatus]|uniref:Aste57867_16285 protein n=1 Tax=Aphanomyces stellatus TaxID=120398 RepID=A0A485L550_9STRA|nr:hypothetical protein As57867_016228 [Aphanomyces stellatus]VFT93061.1 Aste57867_16285 [Aphanomyces stellatus]
MLRCGSAALRRSMSLSLPVALALRRGHPSTPLARVTRVLSTSRPRRLFSTVHVAQKSADDYDMFIYGGLALAVGGFIYYLDQLPTDPVRLETEDLSTKKRAYDLLPGAVPESGLRRVPQVKRLPPSMLATNGIEHGLSGGTVWYEEAAHAYYQQTYWNDEAAYELQSADVRAIRDATYALHAMCLEAVDLVVQSDALLDVFEIPENLRAAVRASWAARERDLLGRFDLIWDGRGPPKMLEYNADTPTILVETAVGQRLWWRHVMEEHDSDTWCFNSIEHQLIHAWRHVVPPKTTVHLASTGATIEEREHAGFMHRTATAAGFPAKHVAIANLEVDSMHGTLVDRTDTTNTPIDYVWKLYPYEWLADERLGDALSVDGKPTTTTKWIEPAWKLVLGNKAMLALLWQMYPDHPNLLPAAYDLQDLIASTHIVVAKPKYGREGAGVVYSKDFTTASEFATAADNASTLMTVGADNARDMEPLYLGEPIYQAYHPTARFSGRRIVLGSWVIHGIPCGLCIREDAGETTNDNSSFVPHYVVGPKLTDGTLPPLSPEQRALYNSLYPKDESVAEPASLSSGAGGGPRAGDSSGGGWFPWFRGVGSDSATTSTTSTTTASPTAAAKENINTKARAHAAQHKATRSPRGNRSGGGSGGGGSRATGSLGTRTAAGRFGGGGISS